MTDTQWPRFQVFHQALPDVPHENAGTVHAPDPQMALLNARDVFVRRPDCVSLWVVLADQITSATAEELAAGLSPEAHEESAALEIYLVFVKSKHIGSHRFAGKVTAPSPRGALHRAVATLQVKPALVWWICPERAVTKSDPAESASFFDPSRGKDFRDQAFYRTDSLLREIRRQAEQGEE